MWEDARRGRGGQDEFLTPQTLKQNFYHENPHSAKKVSWWRKGWLMSVPKPPSLRPTGSSIPGKPPSSGMVSHALFSQEQSMTSI